MIAVLVAVWGASRRKMLRPAWSIVQQVVELDKKRLRLDAPFDAVRVHVVPHEHARVVDHEQTGARCG